MGKKVLIVGGVAGGASAAARLRRLDEHAEIILFERDDYISFANCGLPYHIGETIKERDLLLVQTPQAMNARFNIDVRVNSEVTVIDTEKKSVTVTSKYNGTYEESFDYLILSPGAKPIVPPIPGISNERIHTVRNIPDTDKIKKIVDSGNIRSTIIVGGGFIGIEMAENLRERGLTVSVAEAAPHILPPFDSDMSVLVEKELREHGVDLYLGDSVASFIDNPENITVKLASGNTITADIVILAIGVTPDTSFLKGSGIALGSRGHILVDEHMATNKPSIYAVGDATEVKDFISGQPAAIPLAGPANKQGRIAADNIAGIYSSYKGSLGTSILKVFSLAAGATGNNERLLKLRKVPYHSIVVHPNTHASYYPNALPITIKLLFDESGKILGAQAVGPEGIDKQIDTIATVIRLKGTVKDLTELELAYAPPFSSAKAPVNMAGFVAENVLEKRFEVLSYEELVGYDPNNTIILDVRSELEFSTGSLPNAINIPTDALRQRLGELDKNKLILIYCKIGLQSYIASRILIQNGFKVKSMSGGYKSASSQFPPLPKEEIDSISSCLLTAKEEKINMTANSADLILNACGLSCPGPLMKVKARVDEMTDGQTLEIIASDPGFFEDIKAWTKQTGNSLLNIKKENNQIIAVIQKGGSQLEKTAYSANTKDNKTIVVFSGDLDKALASFVIANGAATMGKKVTMFFTFWGLNILRKAEAVPVKKGLIDSMFGWMMPRGSKALTLSKMNMLGMGTKMMRMVMKNKNVASLEEMIQAAQESGIEIVACQMSMDVMGLKQEELLDGIKIGGVGYYLSQAEDSNVNLFI